MTNETSLAQFFLNFIFFWLSCFLNYVQVKKKEKKKKNYKNLFWLLQIFETFSSSKDNNQLDIKMDPHFVFTF